jgi:hypothetical protein
MWRTWQRVKERVERRNENNASFGNYIHIYMYKGKIKITDELIYEFARVFVGFFMSACAQTNLDPSPLLLLVSLNTGAPSDSSYIR